jgi:hypothetical protein
LDEQLTDGVAITMASFLLNRPGCMPPTS